MSLTSIQELALDESRSLDPNASISVLSDGSFVIEADGFEQSYDADGTLLAVVPGGELS